MKKALSKDDSFSSLTIIFRDRRLAALLGTMLSICFRFSMSFMYLSFWGAIPSSTQGLFLTLYSRITSGRARDHMWYQRLNVCLLCARQLPYLLYYPSNPTSYALDPHNNGVNESYYPYFTEGEFKEESLPKTTGCAK